ncbi:Transaldolase [Niveomyces insectorum RCEF 264]|uniref:Transaldolase n=1 Tax=Niveomyces insectorum RCEF 264 TaxID=1081102 RepID=A0A162J3S8_9HYPO|nr:Transaldolase [Niveomyces insectorum RCEF 264]
MVPGPLQQLQAAGTVLIADTADFEDIARFRPSEGTTNPTLLFLAAQKPAYAGLVDKALAYARDLPTATSLAERLSAAVDCLAVQFGAQIYKLTGRVSTEVDVALSFDTPATVRAALRIVQLYEAAGVPHNGVRIKISATWEGIEAARILQRDHGVSCLVTVVFGLAQAVAAAEAGADAVAPYVGRIADWGRAHGYANGSGTEELDLGVETVSRIQNHLRKYGFKTRVMAASFRSVDQVRQLAGIDLLTAAPGILEAVEKETEPIVPQLTAESAAAADLPELAFKGNEAAFRWAFNSDACAVEKSADAMRRFHEDTEKLKQLLASKL